MTENRRPLADLLQRAGDGGFLRAVAEAVLQRLLSGPAGPAPLEADMEGLVGAGQHERSPERLTWRNG